MTCPSELEWSRALTAGADPAIEAHLAACAACRVAWRAEAEAIELARELPVAMPSPARREEVRTAVLAASASGPPRLARRRWLAPAALGATAAGIVAYVAIPHGSPQPSPSPTQSPPSATRAAVHPHPGARYVAVSSSPDEVIQLVEGAIDVDVEPLRPGERFRVLVGDAELEVRGTTFTVSAIDQHLADVAVRHGRVDLRPRNGSADTLTAGQSWHATTATAIVEPSPSPPSPSLIGSAAPRSASASLPATSASSLSDSRSAAGPRASASRSPPLARGPSGSPGPSSSVGGHPPGSDSLDLAPMKPAADTVSALVERSYDQAWEALRASDFNRAAGGFARVVLLAPDGPLVEDASFWRAVALARGQRADEARSAFRDFLDSFGVSPHAGEASAMLGWLLIDARSYDEAAQRFTAAVRDANPAVRHSARAGLDALARRSP